MVHWDPHILDQELLDLVVSEGLDRGEGDLDAGVGGVEVFVHVVRPVLLTLALEGTHMRKRSHSQAPPPPGGYIPYQKKSQSEAWE